MIRGTLFGRLISEVVDMLCVRGAKNVLPYVSRGFSTAIRGVRKYKEQDFFAVQAIALQNISRLVGETRVHPQVSFENKIAPALKEDTCFVSFEEDRLVGFVTTFEVDPRFGTLWRKYGLISLLAVEENYRGRGHGKYLMDRVLTCFKQEEVDIAMVTINHIGLRNFYSQFSLSTVFTASADSRSYSILARSMTGSRSVQTIVANSVAMRVVPYLELFHTAGRHLLLVLPFYSPLFAYALYNHISS